MNKITETSARKRTCVQDSLPFTLSMHDLYYLYAVSKINKNLVLYN